MSDLQPTAPSVVIEGAERHFFFDYGAIEQIQDIYGVHPILAIQDMFWEDKDKNLSFHKAKAVIDMAYILLKTEVEREKFFNGSTTLKLYTREQVGHIIDRDNVDGIVQAIIRAWTGQNPGGDDEPDEDDEEPEEAPKNAQSGHH